jgi:hypothetical protein
VPYVSLCLSPSFAAHSSLSIVLSFLLSSSPHLFLFTHLLTLPYLFLLPLSSPPFLPSLSPLSSLPSLSPLSPPLSSANGTHHHLNHHGNGLEDEDPHSSPITHSNRWGSLENLLTAGGGEEDDPDLYIAKHSYTTDQAGQLSIKKGDKLKVSRKSENSDWCEATNVRGEIGWVPTSYIAKVDSLEKHSWFHGNITRAEAELSLSSGINGSFLVRESESKPGQFSISLRYDGRVFHYRIHFDAGGKCYVTPESKFDTLAKLVLHHSKNPDGLTTTLHYPAPNPRKPPIYSISHDVDQWEINRSDIEMGQKLGGGQYGEVYKASLKKQHIYVAVKTFKVQCMSTMHEYILCAWWLCFRQSWHFQFACSHVRGIFPFPTALLSHCCCIL